MLNLSTVRRVGTGLLCSILMAVPLMAQNQTPPPAVQQADKLFQAMKWPEAAKAYEEMAKADPHNGRAWYHLGVSPHHMGLYERAIEAYQKAPNLFNNPILMYNLACSYAKLGNKGKAFEWLNKAVGAGFGQLEALKSDADLASLKDWRA